MAVIRYKMIVITEFDCIVKFWERYDSLQYKKTFPKGISKTENFENCCSMKILIKGGNGRPALDVVTSN